MKTVKTLLSAGDFTRRAVEDFKTRNTLSPCITGKTQIWYLNFSRHHK